MNHSHFKYTIADSNTKVAKDTKKNIECGNVELVREMKLCENGSWKVIKMSESIINFLQLKVVLVPNYSRQEIAEQHQNKHKKLSNESKALLR